ncbi:non-hydrolyzing UDP-N-acetylglucosamine 2-epimerase [Polaromonas eurypsychrophila]|uniref:UDP-N-acetyl glucosamine 2-epimerase n=1 Tax=Polaromonas eurypsychrophila TaxID=1614635 RepID=A0A916SFC5_9BURK|nr:UDP-N-acetylglucosamine 2-epimerase (non-hydrolyzing) [Polaromonas eurypsychrophila]GGA94528.1 UDP-N-acetyl glucosamine 2-epimerase [Polaromonas eurypsychrophila]
MKKIVTVLGARPQFIKASAVSAAIAKADSLDEVVIHTGQHFDANMSDVFFAELGMSKPAYLLNIHGGSHGAMTGRMLSEIERVLMDEKPDAVLVYGDTNSTLAGALAAVKLHIPVAHVEAGLRSFNMRMPEEINRILTDRVSSWLFAPTAAAMQHLMQEGTDSKKIYLVGDVMYDVALYHGARVSPEAGMLGQLNLLPENYVLATVHRAENTDSPERLAAIVDALDSIAKNIRVIWPMHPRTRAVLRQSGRLEQLSKRVTLTEPVGYLDMVQLEKYAALIATDSGGVQKEAFFFGVPCVTLRDETEWVELVAAGWNRLASPAGGDDIHSVIQDALGSRGQSIFPYGDGRAAEMIVSHLSESPGLSSTSSRTSGIL